MSSPSLRQQRQQPVRDVGELSFRVLRGPVDEEVRHAVPSGR